MLIPLIKWLHLLLALSLLGTTFYCLIARNETIVRLISKKIWALALCALLTGTLLIYPAHFNFHTPWIIAAYLLLGFYGLLMHFLPPRRFFYIILITLLILIVHDAVTKTTFLFFNKL